MKRDIQLALAEAGTASGRVDAANVKKVIETRRSAFPIAEAPRMKTQNLIKKPCSISVPD